MFSELQHILNCIPKLENMKKIAVKKNIILLNILWISPMLTKSTFTFWRGMCLCHIFNRLYIFMLAEANQIEQWNRLQYHELHCLAYTQKQQVWLTSAEAEFKRVSQICSLQSEEEPKKETWSWTCILTDSIINTAHKELNAKGMYTNSGTEGVVKLCCH